MITFEEGTAKFVYRVAGIALYSDQVLLHRMIHDNFWALPGGRVEMLEPSRETLRREMREELGMNVEVGRLLWVVENFFVHGGVHYHELGLYYLMSFPPDCPLYHTEGPFLGDEEGIELIFEWYQLDDLEETALYPSLLRKVLSSIPETTEHIMQRDA